QVKKEKKKKEARNSRAFSAIVNPRAISGVITDENKEPLPGASVIIKGSSEGAVSDINGNFSLNLSQEEGVLQVAYIGFKTEEISLESGVDELKIELNPDNVSLSEVVVTAYGESSNEDKQQVIVYARPKGGMKNFRQHVAKNLMIPEAAKANNINGTVKLSFDVNINGAISDILVKKSLGFGCDEEAIRLLKTGPNWQSKTINGSPVSSEQTVKIKFKSK
ncbi:MAG: carboxypeptidase-like regulatory domain-containing protein, partial [Bacteroidota bacterium]